MKYQIQLQDFLAYIVIDRGLSLNTKENYEHTVELDIKKNKDKITISLTSAEHKFITNFRMLSEDRRNDLAIMLKALADKETNEN